MDIINIWRKTLLVELCWSSSGMLPFWTCHFSIC